MTKKTDETVYTATYTLTQKGMDGDVHSTLSFNPMVSTQDPNDEAPMAFEQMSYLVQVHLEAIGMIDEHGNLLAPDQFHDEHAMKVSTFKPTIVN